ncbi:MAG TPA: aryl-sulfate sulfotransferase [Thermoanaerobaculia bacterium]|nr:aryl-sulfate sulfotransferase [Thermoanaerobaculia bacterium]
MNESTPQIATPIITPTSHPLVAKFTVTIPPKATVAVQFGLDTSYGRWTSTVGAPEGGGAVPILVAGMKASTLYHMRARVELSNGWWTTTPDQTFQTGALPPPGVLPKLNASTAPGQTPSPGVELVNVIDPIGVSVVCDFDANVLWYYQNTADAGWEGYAFPIKPLKNGNMLASITNLYSASVPQTIPYNSVLREIDLTGNPVRELYLADLNAALAKMKTPQGSVVQALCYSHDVLPLWNGHTILLVQQQKSVWLTAPPGPGQFTILGDAMVDLDENFNPVWVWSVFDNLDVNRHPMGFDAADGYDWTHCNCIQIAPDGNLVLSSRHQNWVMKIDYQGGNGDGTILWKLGYQGDFALVGSESADTDWFFAQHYPNLLRADGDQITLISVFDNGNDRCYATPAGCDPVGPPPPPPFSRGAMFKIDETAMQATLVWQYPLNEYSYWGGNVMLFPDGDIEICASEPIPIGSQPPSQDAPSQVVELLPGPSGATIVWQMTVTTGGTYRSYRIGSLYPGVIWGS